MVTVSSERGDPAAIVAYVRSLASRRPSPRLRSEAEALLEHKWEGVQTEAARVLGSWGGPDSVAALRRWLEALRERPRGWAARGVAVEALAKCIAEEDVEWVLDLYFDLPAPALRYEMLPLLDALPRDSAVDRLRQELRHPDASRRAGAATALTRLAALS